MAWGASATWPKEAKPEWDDKPLPAIDWTRQGQLQPFTRVFYRSSGSRSSTSGKRPWAAAFDEAAQIGQATSLSSPSSAALSSGSGKAARRGSMWDVHSGHQAEGQPVASSVPANPYLTTDLVELLEAEESRRQLQIRVEEDPNGSCPAPVRSFEELGVFPRYLLKGLQEQGFSKPLPIQAQALPLVLSGHDVVGLAQTGSGKTLAFLLPAIVHVEVQEPLRWAEVTPIVLVLAPTRELAVQISDEAAKVLTYSKMGNHTSGLFAVCVYGGGNKREQLQSLRRGSHIVVATPGRLIDFMKAGSVSLRRVTYFVLDEADRMLDMGFQGDVAQISGQVRPDRQVLFFSATWSTQVQELAAGLCQSGSRPVRISCGQAQGDLEGGMHQARESITQQVVVIDHGGDWKKQAADKKVLLEKHLRDVLEEDPDNKVLVFVNQKQLAEELASKLEEDGFRASAMHGGQRQDQRLWVLDEFRKSRLRLLVCTDVLGRGIDIPSVSHVVVHEMGAIEDYVHRIGRTARGEGAKGHALVFFEFWEKNPEIAGQLVTLLERSRQHVPPELRKIADDVASGRRGGWQQWSRHGGGDKDWRSGSRGWQDKPVAVRAT